MGLLADAFLAKCGPDTAWGADDLEAQLADILLHARARWPSVRLDDHRFAEWLGARAPTDRGLAAVCTDDLYLACAAHDGDAHAIELLCAECLGDAEAALRSYGLQAAEIDDVRQLLLTECVVPDGAATGGLARYRGVGALRRWLRTIAVRLAARSHAPARELAVDAELFDALAEAPSSELALLRASYHDELAEAFVAALADLDLRERNLLRQSLLDGLGIDALARMYGVHRSTVARWIAAARRTLATTTMAKLATRTGADPRELESLVAQMHSQIDVSVARLLREGDA